MNKINLYKKHKEGINYLIFGVLTTVLSWSVCFALTSIMNPSDPIQNCIINVLGWVVGVIFAYVTNRKWVFESKSDNITKEITSFVGSRVSTLILDVVMMWLFVNVCKWPYIPVKIISGILVVIGNYILSKIFVFKKKTASTEAE